MSDLWKQMLAAVQEINDYGGNFFSFQISRSIVEQIDEYAESGDASLLRLRGRLLDVLCRGKWPDDIEAFNALFEHYHEAVFYLVARDRGVRLEHIPEAKEPTPDFASVSILPERFEVKTIDISGGRFAHKDILNESLDGRISATEDAKTVGAGFHEMVVSPHGDARDTKEAVEKVMEKLAGNVKRSQFATAPTFLVAVMARTALRMRPDELKRQYIFSQLGGMVSGHLWTIAAHTCDAHFFDIDRDWRPRDMGPLNRAGLLKDFTFIRGIIFLATEWNELGSANERDDAVLRKAYHLYGVWNDAYQPSGGTAATLDQSQFAELCDEWVRTEDG